MLCNEDFITTWSLQSNTTPNSKNVWNNVGGKESEDAIIFTDRSDSGVTSPHSHHHIDDRINVISPCDLNLLDHITNEDLRRRLSQIIKKPNIDEDDKICLQQVLAFVQNLDAISHGHHSLPSSEESSSLEYIKSRVSDYSSSSRSSDISPTLQLQKPKSATSQGRIVATVLPYSSTVSTPNDSPQRKLRAWHTTSLTESGVFEGDLSETSVYTQTEPEEFSSSTETTEAQKLNRIREQFEECAKKSAFAKVPVTSSQSLSPNFSDQKRIQYYKDRLEVLEGKLLIYESSGDIQAKRLADRLQREIILENLVKELQDRVDFLEVENSEIEEEKCEFEEAENDTRLRLQRLEVELEILSQRNIELEMSREALQNKLKDCRTESAILRDDLSAVQTQVCHLEEDRCRFKENFEFLHSVLPALVLFNAFCVANHKMGNCIERDLSQSDLTRHDEVGRMANSCDCAEADDILRREISNLRSEIRSLKRQINDLNSRHSEAMACADGCWEDLEKSYNDRLMASKSKEESLQKKIKQLEDCLQDDSRAANEKICQLEDAERELRMCLQKVSRDQRKTLQEHGLITEEYHRLKEKYEKLVEQVDGPIKEALDREKTQNKNLKDELGYIRRINCEQDMHYRNELDCFQLQLDKLQKELLQIQVTNSELREEVCTLEKEVMSLHQAKKEDFDKIRCLSDEVRTKEEMCDVLEKRVEKLLCGSYYRQRQAVDRQMSASFSGAVSLAQELNGSPVKRLKIEEPVDLKTAAKNLGTVLGSMKDSARTIPSHRQFQNVANDVKKLAESILANKSEVSEAVETPRYNVSVKENTINASNEHLEKVSYKKFENKQIFFTEPICHDSLTVDLNVDEAKFISEVPSGLRTLSWPQKQRKAKSYKIPRAGFRKRFSKSLRSEIWKVISRLKTVGIEETCLIEEEESLKNPSSQSIVSFYSVIEESNAEIFFEPISDVVSSIPTEHWSDTQVEQESEMLMNVTNFLMPTTTEDRPRTTQNDRNRDHTNLSLEPNIEAPAGPRQQPAGQRQTYQAKDKNEENDDGNNKNKQRSSLENYFTPRGSCLCSNVSQNGFCKVSPQAGSSIIKLSFSTTESEGLQGSYECFCEEDGSCHKFGCQCYEILEDTNKKLDGKEANKTGMTKTDYCQNAVYDFKTKPTHECFCVCKSLLVNSFIGSCENEKTETQESNNSTRSTIVPSGPKEYTGPNANDKNLKNSANEISEISGRLYSKDLGNLEEGLSGRSNFDDFFRSADTPKQTKNESVIQLLKSIFDVLQTMREENLHLGPMSSKNIDIHLNEPFNGLPPAPPSSPKFQKQLQQISSRSSRNNLEFEEETDRCIINIEDKLTIFEPPERDVEDYGRNNQQVSTTSQRLIPVDMDLLRTDEELIWEPCSNFDKPQVEEEGKISRLRSSELEDIVPLKAQFRQFPEEIHSQSSEELKDCQGSSCPVDRLSQFLTLGDQLQSLSEEKLLKISEMNKPREALLLKVNSPNNTNKRDVGTACPKWTNDVGTDCPNFGNDDSILIKSFNSHRQPTEQQNQEMSQFIESILFDLRAMNSIRKNNFQSQSFAKLPCPSTGGWQRPSKDLSFPVTIETVQELGANSLFVKWRVQNIGNIGGYEIFLDGHLTNRYFNCIHRSAVICNVNLYCPHRITLRAKPLLPLRTSLLATDSSSSTSNKCPSTAVTTHPEASCPQPDGSVWYPSVYHFEPNSLSAPIHAVLY